MQELRTQSEIRNERIIAILAVILGALCFGIAFLVNTYPLIALLYIPIIAVLFFGLYYVTGIMNKRLAQRTQS